MGEEFTPQGNKNPLLDWWYIPIPQSNGRHPCRLSR